ncbi:putative amidoligase domain-containing protein [Paenibacillus rigui]|uniref:Uncharacterized protein n=1 Tax=Paenibacillus rigui TaxID=554312 RepID=A0A229UX45_9BACL|nr:hypothetical protein [Paenibacillus rigui]OXM87933.1 hypothetical protein CF651_02175 [Paenibacillus rigui]
MRVFLLHSNEPTLHLLLERLRIPHGTQLTAQQEKQQPCIIHWGCYHAEKASRLLVQPIKCQLRANNPRKAAVVLKLHGIRWESARQQTAEQELVDAEVQQEGRLQPPQYTYEYIVPVFHLQALTLFQRKQGIFYGAPHPMQTQQPPDDFTEVTEETPSYHAIRAKREAVKAIYALGLDFGVVRIGVGKGGELFITELETAPTLTARLAELFSDALHRFAEEQEAEDYTPRPAVMLGADPEFVLRNPQGKIIFASRFMEKDGPVGCDAIVLPSFRKIYPLAELRPEPSRDIGQLLKNIHRTMQNASRKISDESLEWLAGGMPVKGFPLGGHIHFSGVPLSSEFLRVLDNYLALPLVLLEDTTTGLRKPRYGFLGDFRRQRHGGFEYRVLPSWLVSPRLARGVLSLAKLIADHYRQLRSRPLDEPLVQEAYYLGDKQRIRPLLPGLWNDLVRLPAYRTHERYLTPLKTMMLHMECWKEQEDIRVRWKIGPFARKEVSSINS